MSVGGARVLAWDGPTRVFKWTLVLLVLDGWVSNRFGASLPQWHIWNGYLALTLVVFRVLWGFVGGSTARFSSFVAGPRRALAYLRGAKYLGHNPFGGWMALGLLALVAAQALTGLFSADEDRLIIEGPLAGKVSDATVAFASHRHHLIFAALEVLIVVHIAVNLFYAAFRRDPLVKAMVTGEKPAADYADMRSAAAGSWGRAAVCLAIAAALVFGGITAAGGRLF
ncbi:MAG: cytochrome b/b6 domain-containing protein [Hyphomicrobiales bacterium]|nr:cytochrome b/b6 domain-containing protein [Hyphomicrobiales bacterium]